MANRTQVLLVLLVLLLDDHVALPHPPHVLQELRHLVQLDAPVGDYVPQLLVSVGVLEQQRVVVGQVEDLQQGVQRVAALHRPLVAAAFDFVADGQLELRPSDVLKNKTGAACDAHQVQFLQVGDLRLYLLRHQLHLLLGPTRHRYNKNTTLAHSIEHPTFHTQKLPTPISNI